MTLGQLCRLLDAKAYIWEEEGDRLFDGLRVHPIYPARWCKKLKKHTSSQDQRPIQLN